MGLLDRDSVVGHKCLKELIREAMSNSKFERGGTHSLHKERVDDIENVHLFAWELEETLKNRQAVDGRSLGLRKT